jgi:hypothetical protein
MAQENETTKTSDTEAQKNTSTPTDETIAPSIPEAAAENAESKDENKKEEKKQAAPEPEPFKSKKKIADTETGSPFYDSQMGNLRRLEQFVKENRLESIKKFEDAIINGVTNAVQNSSVVNFVSDKVDQAKNKVSEVTDEALDKLGKKVDEIKDAAIKGFKETGSSIYQSVANKLSKINDAIEDKLGKNLDFSNMSTTDTNGKDKLKDAPDPSAALNTTPTPQPGATKQEEEEMDEAVDVDQGETPGV